MNTGGERPNIVFVLVDDQGYGDLSCHGHPELKTPAIDRMWSESVRLTDFHVAPMCTPTRGSLLTGRDALRHCAVNVSSGRSMLRPDLVTLSEVLAAEGYRTGLFGKWHLGDNYPYRPQDRGFDRAIWFPSSHVTSAPDRWENDYFDTWFRSEDGDVRQYPGYCTDVLFDEAIGWMSDAPADRPFFAYLPLNAAHAPWLVPDGYRKPYEHLGHPLASYLGMLANIDENMARLDDWLHESGLFQNTLVIYMTDNGGDRFTTGIYNAGMRGVKTELWEGGHRVPAFFRWPAGGIGGEGRGRDVDELTIAQDFMPTITSLCGVETGNLEVDGSDLTLLLRDEDHALPERMATIQYSRMQRAEPVKGDAVVLWNTWRYLVSDASLYDVSRDPGQELNVGILNPDIVRSMAAHYEAWWDEVSFTADATLRIPVGSADANPTALSAADWRDVFLDQQQQVRAGVARNGTWHITVARSGRYRISLARWPRESGLAIRSPAAAFQGGDCLFPEGKALPIARASLELGSYDLASSVSDTDASADFEVRLWAGDTTLRTAFLDSEDRELCGAYYVYVERLGGMRLDEERNE